MFFIIIKTILLLICLFLIFVMFGGLKPRRGQARGKDPYNEELNIEEKQLFDELVRSGKLKELGQKYIEELEKTKTPGTWSIRSQNGTLIEGGFKSKNEAQGAINQKYKDHNFKTKKD